MKRSEIRDILETGLHSVQVRLHAKLVDQLLESAFSHIGRKVSSESLSQDQIRLAILQFLIRWVRDRLNDVAVLQTSYDEFVHQNSHAVTAAERGRCILEFSKLLGSTSARLRGERRALKRWFGFEAVSERFHRRISETHRDVAFVLERIGVIAAADIKAFPDLDQAGNRWKRLELEQLVKPLLGYGNSTAIRIAAFQSLATSWRALPLELHEQSINDDTLRYIYRSALDRRQEIALQCEALKLLAEISPRSLKSALKDRLGKRPEGDDLFVRRVAVVLLGQHLKNDAGLAELLEHASGDPSPAVRQLLVPALQTADSGQVRKLLARLVLEDPVTQVRAAAVQGMVALLARMDLRPYLGGILAACLHDEKDDFVLRVALKVCADVFHQLRDGEQTDAAEDWCKELVPEISRLHSSAASVAVRRYASDAYEHIWVRSDSLAWQMVQDLMPLVNSLREGRRTDIQEGLHRHLEDERFGRVLAWIARQDFGLDVELGRAPRIVRGNRFGFRAWRFLHELLNPSTDKRQALSHTVGRVFRGTLRAPSGILSELAMTRVPGEPLFIASENGWRPYLPLVDELISALDQPFHAGPLKLYTGEGVTEVHPPASLGRRLLARLHLITRFQHFAGLRNWHEDSGEKPGKYLESLQALGFEFRFSAYSALPGSVHTADPGVTRFFPAVFPFSAGDWAERIKDYFFSVYENSLSELILFLMMVSSWFVGRHLWMAHLVRQTRRAMPLVVGGWGTRGKSGTERLKAALFNALGYSVVSKTTGCEAMFLHGHAQGSLREMFLFRPYDKATIWEQVQVFSLAKKLGGEVFLWECMGLTPAYIDILQQHWMRDDLSTITNTYPDHEDLQGPAGINIPRVMTNFIPPRATLVTTEEQMLPILSEAASQRGTRVKAVGWLEAGMLSPDLLARFPYEEHPYNIALVLAMAEEFGIDRDFAIREMADRVVADLGVLKVSPEATVRGRMLEFTNGMSANERFGCMANWERVGYQSQDTYKEPGVWLTTVVNNRADRVPRSRVFASMLVNDLMADRHVLIGTNLDGFLNYVDEAWDDYMEGVTLWPASGKASAADVLEQAARRFRLAYQEAHVRQELERLLLNLALDDARHVAVEALLQPSILVDRYADHIPDAESLVRYIGERKQTVNEYAILAERISGTGSRKDPGLDREFRDRLKVWFKRKLVVIDDSHANGEQVLDRLVQATPPGMRNRIMGVQNIKGTGLDFVYRWQAWENCHQACEMLRSDKTAVAEQGLRTLAGFRDFGSLSCEKVQATLETVRHGSFAQSERVQAELNVIASNLELAMRRVRAHIASQRSVGWMSTLANAVEAFLDAGDAVSRRKRANLIYQELAAERISHEQAALELQVLNKRQKGGWLLARLETLWANMKLPSKSKV